MTTGAKKYSLYAKTALRDLDSLSWNLAPRPNTAYIGWLNRGNLGDEAMFLSHRQRLTSDQPLAKVPLNAWSRRLASLRTRPATNTLLVGGGTLLGHDGWLKSITEARALLRPRRFVVMGAGMEDIDFALSRGLATKHSLRDWAELLNKCEYVGVRGPRSQQHLARINVDSEIVGDAALWFDSRPLPMRSPTCQMPPYVAVNVVGYLSSDDEEDVRTRRRREVADYLRDLVDKLGLGVILFGMERRDLYEARRLQKVVPSVQIMAWSASVARVVALIKGSELVVAERLHGAILAAASSVPFIMLAYKPKSYDFAESVGVAESCITPDTLSAEVLMQRTRTSLAGGASTQVVDDARAVLGDRFNAAHQRWVTREL